jgi:hypothetical protein
MVSGPPSFPSSVLVLRQFRASRGGNPAGMGIRSFELMVLHQQVGARPLPLPTDAGHGVRSCRPASVLHPLLDPLDEAPEGFVLLSFVKI